MQGKARPGKAGQAKTRQGQARPQNHHKGRLDCDIDGSEILRSMSKSSNLSGCLPKSSLNTYLRILLACLLPCQPSPPPSNRKSNAVPIPSIPPLAKAKVQTSSPEGRSSFPFFPGLTPPPAGARARHKDAQLKLLAGRERNQKKQKKNI